MNDIGSILDDPRREQQGTHQQTEGLPDLRFPSSFAAYLEMHQVKVVPELRCAQLVQMSRHSTYGFKIRAEHEDTSFDRTPHFRASRAATNCRTAPVHDPNFNGSGSFTASSAAVQLSWSVFDTLERFGSFRCRIFVFRGFLLTVAGVAVLEGLPVSASRDCLCVA